MRNAISVYGLRLHEAYESKVQGSLVNNDTLMQRVPSRCILHRDAMQVKAANVCAAEVDADPQ